jgi:glycosyltransferase involved in cell wall biosynthesis
MLNKSLTLTIVIPAYNEQSYLSACLDSIAAQSVKPDEVLVIDNNSTDETAAIAELYSFVKLIREPRQHQSFAQQTGFNAAGGDIIGRIDADTVLPPNWVKTIKAYFVKNPEVVGLTGTTVPYDFSIGAMGTKGFEFYINLASRMAGHRLLWGANCALRASAWSKINKLVMTRPDIWEDYDLSFCLAAYGQLRSINGIEVGSSFRAVRQSLIRQTRYQFRAVRTFYFHRGLASAAIMMLVWSTLYLLFIPVMLDKYVLNPLARLLAGGEREPAADVVQFEAE